MPNPSNRSRNMRNCAWQISLISQSIFQRKSLLCNFWRNTKMLREKESSRKSNQDKDGNKAGINSSLIDGFQYVSFTSLVFLTHIHLHGCCSFSTTQLCLLVLVRMTVRQERQIFRLFTCCSMPCSVPRRTLNIEFFVDFPFRLFRFCCCREWFSHTKESGKTLFPFYFHLCQL